MMDMNFIILSFRKLFLKGFKVVILVKYLDSSPEKCEKEGWTSEMCPEYIVVLRNPHRPFALPLLSHFLIS